MADAGIAIAAIALAVSAVGTGVSVHQSREAADENKEAMKAKQRVADLESRRKRIQEVRERRIRAASIEAQGIEGSSTEGAISSIGSSVGANIGAINTSQHAGAAISERLSNASQHTSNAQSGQAIANLGSQGISLGAALI